ncbi:hypothetical protein [Micromonospora echinospora]|uniref:hypothetical protein n=1 Tax=Micromonospora echinospora TaxID=1877 RepID=UPI00366F5A11
MPVRPHPEDRGDTLLVADDGMALARMRVRDEAGTRVAAEVRQLPGAVRTMFHSGEPVPPLSAASARLVDPHGRSAGHARGSGRVPAPAGPLTGRR